MLIKAKKNSLFAINDNLTQLLIETIQNNIKMCELLINYEPNFDNQDIYGNSVLCHAILNKSKQMIGDLTLNLDSKKTCQDDNRLRQIIILETPSSASSSSDSTSLNSTTPNELQSSTISNVSQPMTSAAANSSMQPSKQNYNLIVAYINPNNNALKISNIDEEDENYDDDEN